MLAIEPATDTFPQCKCTLNPFLNVRKRDAMKLPFSMLRNETETMLASLFPYLESLPHTQDSKLYKSTPASTSSIASWEKLYHKHLPLDLKHFLRLSNGMLIQWHSTISNTPQLAGKIDLNPLDHILPLRDFTDCFLLEDCLPYGQVAIRIHDVKGDSDPTVEILFIKDGADHYICDSFSAYFRLSLACLGIKGWQDGYTYSFTNWTRNMMSFYTPKMLEQFLLHQAQTKYKFTKTTEKKLNCKLNFEKIMKLLK